MSGVDKIFDAENRKKRLYVEMLREHQERADRGTGRLSQIRERSAVNDDSAQADADAAGRQRWSPAAAAAAVRRQRRRLRRQRGISKAEAYRFLNQATFGATPAEAQNVIALGYEAWIDQQLQRPASLELPHVQQAFASYPPGAEFTRLHEDRVDIWLQNALHAPDQLRQRVAFALSQIMVVSQTSALVGYPWALAELLRHARATPSATSAS